MNWVEYIVNNRAIVLKQYMSQVLQNRYQQNEPIIEKLTAEIKNDKEAEQFNRLIADIYETAYFKAVEEHREQLAKLGFKVNVVPSS